MARATARDLVRVIRTAKQFFVQTAAATGCSCINGFGITMKRVAGKKTTQPAIVFYVSRKFSLRNLPVHNRIPQQINIPWEYAADGVLEVITDVQAVQFQVFQNTTRERPCPGGFSIGHVDITAGTLGCWVKDKLSGQAVILSNNHVLANSNDAAIGDPIVQPGPADGGSDPADRIATLTRFHVIDFSSTGENRIDAAIATPVDPADVAFAIHDIGTNIPVETRDITVDDLGQFVQKSGRTTEHTTGFIDTVNATVQVKYGTFQKATFVDQIIIEAPVSGPDIAAGGDSGSTILDDNQRLIGLLFAGSEATAGQPATAIINPIKHIFRLLDLETLPL